MKKNPRPILSDHIYINLTKNCTDFKLRRGYVMETLSEESAAFPLAYSILFYKDLMQVERLLRAIYRPNNIYCLHMDAYRYFIVLFLHATLISFSYLSVIRICNYTISNCCLVRLREPVQSRVLSTRQYL